LAAARAVPIKGRRLRGVKADADSSQHAGLSQRADLVGQRRGSLRCKFNLWGEIAVVDAYCRGRPYRGVGLMVEQDDGIFPELRQVDAGWLEDMTIGPELRRCGDDADLALAEFMNAAVKAKHSSVSPHAQLAALVATSDGQTHKASGDFTETRYRASI
jgi:hypothetical protein